jgi:hypothetical protein
MSGTVDRWYDRIHVPRPQATLERRQKLRRAGNPYREHRPVRRTRKADKQVLQHVLVVVAAGIILTVYAAWVV